MKPILDAFWRALVYCWHPKVLMWAMLPLIVMVAMALGAGAAFWYPMLDGLRMWLDSIPLVGSFWSWLESVGLQQIRTILIPLLLILAITPLLVVCCLLAVTWLALPSLVHLAAKRRFAHLLPVDVGPRTYDGLGALLLAVLALLLLTVTLPLWMIPPLVFIIPPLIWGWLSYRINSKAAWGQLATKAERKALMQEHRYALLFMGLITGYLAAAPSLIWASGALFATAFPILVPIAIWLYVLIFVFSALWSTHYCLKALEDYRLAHPPIATPTANAATGASQGLSTGTAGSAASSPNSQGSALATTPSAAPFTPPYMP